jgi:hypothetical protein
VIARIVAFVVTVLVLLFGAWLIYPHIAPLLATHTPARYQPLLSTAGPVPTPPKTDVVYRFGPADLKAIRERGGLITYVMTLTQDSEAERPAQLGFWNGERVQYHAESDALAGVDLAQVTYDEARKTLVLPPAELFWTAPVEDANGPVSGQTAHRFTFFHGPQPDPALANGAQWEAERRIHNGACEHGITEKAAGSAERQVTRLLREMRITDVAVEASAGACEEWK